MSGAGGDWVGDFAGDGWPDQPAPQPPQANGGGRELVEIITCPKCRARGVRCTKRQPTHSNWTCDACFHGWKELPKVGDSKGFIV